jgi:hypothetical protein
MLNHASRSGAFPGLKATSKFKNDTWVIVPVGTTVAFAAAQALHKAHVSCTVEALTVGGGDGAKAFGGDSKDDAPCGGASLAGEACGTKTTDALVVFGTNQLFVPNVVERVGVKRVSFGGLEEAKGGGQGASGAVARKKSKKSKIEALKAEVALVGKEGTLLVSPPQTLNTFCRTKQRDHTTINP